MAKNLLKIITESKNEIRSFNSSKAELVTFINPVSYCKILQYKDLLKQFDYLLIDGILLSSFINIFGIKNVRRSSFDMTSLAPQLFNYSIKNNKSIFFIGSKDHEITSFINLIKKEYPLLKIAGYRNGYIEWDAIDRIVSDILKCKPSFVVVGMGTPLQEQFMVEFKRRCMDWNGMIFSCGGFFHQTQTDINYYPELVNKLNLRMPYRLFKEGLYSRLKFYPIFVYHFLKDLQISKSE